MKLGIVVHTCDKYELLFQGFFYFFEKNFGYSSDFDYYFVTEKIEINHTYFKSIKTSNGMWSTRLKIALNQIPNSHILYLQEDMWIYKLVNKKFFNRAFLYAFDHKIPLLKLHKDETNYVVLYSKDTIDNIPLYVLNNQKSKYLCCHQPSIWQKSFIETLINVPEGPSTNEIRNSKMLSKSNLIIGQMPYFKDFEIAFTQPDDFHSFYFGVTNRGYFSYTAQMFFDQLKADSLLSQYAEKLENYLNNEINVSGLKKSKRNIFQRIINKIKDKMGFV
ncbi:MAG: hypothetical protein SFY32_13790 [Bacteroidota bacterium]|nr:hypothetical protein [Bacteroidota bacterium]